MVDGSAAGAVADALCSDDAACTVLGVSISAVAAFLYASGLCVQRASLMVREAGEGGAKLYGCTRPCCFRCNSAVWLLGLAIYGIGGMFLGTLSLRYIPLSLSSSIFSSVLVFNAFVARLWLKEQVKAVDIVCYLLIMAGISVDAVYLPASPTKIDVHVLSRLFREPVGITFWIVILTILMGLQVTVWWYLEPQHQVNSSYKHCDHGVYKLAMVCYPVVLGMWEGIAWMMLKTANDLFDRIVGPQALSAAAAQRSRQPPHNVMLQRNAVPAAGEAYNSTHWLFWFGCSIAGPMLFLTITWVRKSYARFPTTQIFPLELGALTIVSVNGGLVFFEEYKGTTTGELLIIYAGIALMISAMVSIAFFKTQSRQPVALEMPVHVEDQIGVHRGTASGAPRTNALETQEPKAVNSKPAQAPRDYHA